MAMKLSTGKVAFSIEFDNGDKDCIYFNPSDPELATRLIAAKDKISARMESMKFEDFELSNTGEPIEVKNIKSTADLTDEQMAALIENAEKISKIITDTKNIVCEELDAAFDSKISAVVFKHCSPFAIVDGNYFILNFLEAIAPEVQKFVSEANADADRKIQKHIGKYLK